MTGWKVSADTGGTFTDCIAEGPDGLIRRGKVLSSGRLRAVIEAVHPGGRIGLAQPGMPHGDWLAGRPVWIAGAAAGTIRSAAGSWLTLDRPPVQARPGDLVEVESGLEAPVLALRLLLPEQALTGDVELSFRLGTTKGTNALLEKKGARVALFLTEGFADLLLIRDQKRPELFARSIRRPAPLCHRVYGIPGRIGTDGREEQPLDCARLAACARDALAAGCTAAAVCLLNSWRDPAHEEQAGVVLEQAGFRLVRLSARIRPLIKYLDRAETTLVDTLLGPVLDSYLDRVETGIRGRRLWIMTSAGGLVSRARFNAVDSLVSGPAGGLLGAVAAGRRAGMERIIGLDMGGTSTDVSRWKRQLELRQSIEVGQARILTPAMPIESVAAGGGSICTVCAGRLTVGPESAGAEPGPAAYGAGGPLTLTDIHLLLGRIDPSGFAIPLRIEDARRRMREVAAVAGEPDWRALAEGFLQIATERMAHAIRKVSLREGEDPAGYGLVVFGGAGGLHACRLAEQLGMDRLLFPSDAGLLSARGIHQAPREAVVERQLFTTVDVCCNAPAQGFSGLRAEALDRLLADGVPAALVEPAEFTVFVRIRGQETGLPLAWAPGCDLRAAFRERFVATFGYCPAEPALETVKLRVRLLERTPAETAEQFPAGGAPARPDGRVESPADGLSQPVPVHDRGSLAAGARVAGPAIIRDPFGTCYVEDGWQAVAGTAGSVMLSPTRTAATRRAGTGAIERTLVCNRLDALVEEMGDQLRRTALSTNIRERLDFSCALLDARGRLLVNAPHIPVHLGAMGLCVRECVARLQPRPGDVIMTNHPGFGGSHLPDVTLVCGLFARDGTLLGYLANRAHHAEWGGRAPGSMPADAVSLAEEGVIVAPRWLIRAGRDHFSDIEALLRAPPWPSRAPAENRADLEAQLAALQRGRQLFDELLSDYGAARITGHLEGLYGDGARALQAALARMGPFSGEAGEALDDGHTIKVRMEAAGGRLLIDFGGTSAVHPGNLNATPAIVRSAVLYVLRLLVDTPLPLNEGLLDAVQILLPECFLNPRFPDDPARCPAVVGGNVETSQRVVDALIRALGLMAAGQGTMNNLIFGNARFGYYETIGGGAGAAEGFAGASGVHVHMTNTAITDPEILEQRFPVSCREFTLRRGSGGAGRFAGGDGLVREIRFREAVSVSLLGQNRRAGPRGAHGGGDGQPGRQWVVRADGSREPVPGIAQLELQAGEAIRIETPGGGGWGEAAGYSRASS